jgi:hypothetical protein
MDDNPDHYHSYRIDVESGKIVRSDPRSPDFGKKLASL